ncbi:PLP-dependent aminotransferase family protein [Vibrio sp. HN007]|uniref:aminotransferase-like domain-containing protein n=1 Tax=Vibrio iocasae TaxID=3098914 RepID=UPI0035D470FF
MPKYERLAKQIRSQIQDGIWSVGDKLPSLRKQTELSGLSLMTVMQSYQLLESQGWIVSHARSGYVVAPIVPVAQSSQPTLAVDASETVDINDFIFDVLQASRTPNLVSFGTVYPDPKLYPKNQVNRALSSAASSMPTSSALDNFPPGNTELRHIIAKRYAAQGMHVHPDEIVITSGALEALNLSLQAVTKAGDWVVVESPGFYGAFQSLQRLNLRALSVKTDPNEGMDLDSLEEALKTHSVKACWLMTNHQNPTGFTMPKEKKQRLIELLSRYQVHLIEDDVNNELYFSSDKPLPAKAFDDNGMVMHCASFSKSLIAGYRIGWVAAGKMALKIQKLQLMSTLSVSAPIQLAFAKYLTTRNYENHLRQLRRTLEQRKYEMWKCMTSNFPCDVKIHYSEGGYFLWIELPKHLDATKLYQLALAENIGIAPGRMFSINHQFDHCFRVNSSFECTGQVEQAIKRLGCLIKEMQNSE